MSGAFLALWNDYPSAMAEEYEAWHTFEHVPERLTAPGMLGARRYASFSEAEHHYFTLYELADLQTIENPAYLDLVRNPTPWSAKMRRHFSNVLRIPARTVASGGRGIGSCALVQACSVERGKAAASCLRLAAALNGLVSTGMLLSFRVGMAEPNQPYEVFHQSAVGDEDAYDVVLVSEGMCRQAMENVRSRIMDAVGNLLQPRKLLRDEFFNLVVSFPDSTIPPDRATVSAGAQLMARFDR